MALSPATSTSENRKVKVTPAPPTTAHLEAREGPPAAHWQAVKEEIRILYEKKPLRDVRRILEQDHGFRATERMFKARLSQWGFTKNYSDRDYQICAVLNHTRHKSGKRDTAFVVHGHRRSVKDLHKYIKGRKMSEDEFLDSALRNIDLSDQQQQAQYAHVRAYTPAQEFEGETSTCEDIHTPSDPAPGAGSTSGSSASASYLLYHSHRLSTPSQNPSPCHSASPALFSHSSTTQFGPSARHSYTSHSPSKDSATSVFAWPYHTMSLPSSPADPPKVTVQDEDHPAAAEQDISPSLSCGRLGKEVEHMALQVVDAPSLRSLCGHDDIRSWRLMSDTSSTNTEDYEVICPTCHDLTRDHFISLPNLEQHPPKPRNILNENGDGLEGTFAVPASSRGHDHSWRWVARCFAACIYMSRGNDVLLRRSLRDADAEFEKMLTPRQDPKVLLALTQTLQILHVHDQGVISKTIISSAYKVAERVLGRDDPLTTIVRWMVSVADLNMREQDIDSSTLRDLHTQFVQRHGHTDPRSIASLYCYGYMLNVERRLEAAEAVLRKVYDVSCVHLGQTHLQSISALTNLHRALQRQGRIDEAIHFLEKAIADSRDTLGQNHPRRLESIRLLGLMHEGLGNMEIAESLYWRVLEGRIKMLGRNHKYTQGMKVDLETSLKRMGKWVVKRPRRTNPENEIMSFDGNGNRNGNVKTEILAGRSLHGILPVETEVEFVESEAQLRMQDLFEWDPDDKWYHGTDSARTNDLDGGNSSSVSIDLAEDTHSQAEAF